MQPAPPQNAATDSRRRRLPPNHQQPRRSRRWQGCPDHHAPGPGGTLIASDDLEALDQLEDLLSTVASRSAGSEREYAVFYLKYSKAPIIAEVLAAIFGGTAGGKDKGIIGDLASNALGNVGGGLMGDLLLGGGGAGGGAFASGTVDIVPDARLNALFVHAKPADLDTVEQLLKVLDQRTGPENVEAEAQPRPIPVYNTTASEVAQIVQQVYQDRDGRRRRWRDESAGHDEDDPRRQQSRSSKFKKCRSPSIRGTTFSIVRAPDALFKEVKALVNELDQSLADSPQTTKVVSLQHTNSAAVQRALTSMLGNVKTSTTPAQPTASGSQPGQRSSSQGGERRLARRADAASHAPQLGNDAGNASDAGTGRRERGRSGR